MRGTSGRRSLLTLVAGLLVLAWGASYAPATIDLWKSERADDFRPAIGTVVTERGIGPLRFDTVRLPDDSYVRVAPGDERLQDPRRQVMVSSAGGAHYPDSPVLPGLWIRFAGVAVALSALGVALLAMGSRGLGEVIFGQRAPGATVVWWVPGGGTRGSGQAPPYVPYTPDWDPENRRKPR